MILGRFIFAIGGESLAVAQNAYIVKWFKGRELNTMFGIQLSFARIGSTINQATMLLVYKWIVDNGFFTEHKALGASLFMAFLTTVLSLLCGVICWFFDKNRDKYLILDKNQKIDNGEQILSINETEKEAEKFKMTDILGFPLSLWLIYIICVLFYAAIFPLVSFGQLFYINKFGLQSYIASVCNGMIYLVAIPSSIFAGMLVDYFGRNVHFIIISVMTTICGHCLLAFTFLTPFAATIILGCAYSLLAASLWPCVAYVVPERAVATAYGVVQSIQNLGLGVLFILIGALVDSKGYLILELVFILLLCMALAVAILLYFVDSTNGSLLTMDGHSRREKMKQN
uniref:Lysosomal dipeptide transporter MFSD1 n=1 Tax=Romanomermis culicivorax TaxID=13658 RepID=A0A915HR97_ROMCU